MPGLAGIIGGRHGEGDHAVVKAMTVCMSHESFYLTGHVADKRLQTLVGWSCHAGSFSDCLPVWNEQRDLCLVFIGENYADRSDLQALSGRGHAFDPDNASALIHWYEEEGIRFLKRLNGWFSGVLIDLREGKTILFNDRYGLSRLYFCERNGAFHFSSEAKSLLQQFSDLRVLNPQALAEFFSCGCVLQNRTLFEGITLLPPGSAWTFEPGKTIRKETYFQPEEWESLSPLSPSDYYEQLKETWARTLPRYFAGPESVALSLTGGVDSRMIIGWAPTAPGELPCYTFGGRYRDCMDVKVARTVADICGQPHQVIPIGADFLGDFSTLAEKTVYISDGTMDVTGAIDLYVQRVGRQIAPVRITGTYGGEILRRLVAFKPVSPPSGLLQPDLDLPLRKAGEKYADELQGHALTFTAFKQTPWYMHSKFTVERSQVSLRMPYFDNDLVALSYRAPTGMFENNDPALRLIVDGRPALKTVGTDRGLGAGSTRGITRVRHAWQQFLFKAEYAYDYGMPQRLAQLDHAFAPLHLERLFLGRHKFHHFRVFYRDELASYVKEVLLDARSRNRSYLQRDRVESMVQQHTRGSGNYTVAIHKALTLELIQRQLLDVSSP